MGYDAVWFTPLLDFGPVVDGIAASPARQLLVGGTGDPYWSRGAAQRLLGPDCEVCEVPGADHLLTFPGDTVRSVEAHLTAARAVEAFLGSLGRG